MIWNGESVCVCVSVRIRGTIIIVLLEEQSDGAEAAISKLLKPRLLSHFFMRHTNVPKPVTAHIRMERRNTLHAELGAQRLPVIALIHVQQM